MPSPFDHSYFQRLEQDAAEQFNEAQLSVAEQRTKFFERLALTSGGAVVLSVTLLTNMLGKAPIHSSLVLIAGWAAFAAALMAALFRELPFQHYRLNTYLRNYLKQAILKKQDLLARLNSGCTVVADPEKSAAVVRHLTPAEILSDIQEREARVATLDKSIQSNEEWFRRCERISMCSFWLGAVLLAVFAAVNTLFNTHYLLK